MLPLSLLLLLSTSSATFASIPPDPFAHPKYSLSFLNDLPIEHSQAHRWIKNGLPASTDAAAKGGVDVFFGESDEDLPVVDVGMEAERIGIDESEREEVERLVGGEGEGDHLLHQQDLSGAGLEQIILSSPSSEVEDASKQTSKSPTSNYTLQHLLLPPGPRAYLCLLPPAPPPLSELPPPPPVPPMDPALPEKLLGHLGAGCLYAKQGWFTYAYCHGKEVRQFRETGRPWPPPVGGYVPQIDTNHDDYVLGRAAADLNADQNLPPISLARGAGQRYLVQRWAGGTLCDKTGRGREIEVQFHCSMTGTDGIGLIKEVSTCSYILIINTPRLCNIPGFSSTHLSEPPSGISCREIVPDGSIPVPKIEEDGTTPTRPSKNRTPLPSWATLPPPPSPNSPHINPKPPVLNPLAQLLTPKPVQGGAESVTSLLQRVLAQLDASESGSASGSEGVVGEEEAVVFLRVERDEETGEVRIVPDGASASDAGVGAEGQDPTDPSTLQAMRDWLATHQSTQNPPHPDSHPHPIHPRELEEIADDLAYEAEMAALRQEALQIQDEEERRVRLEELERWEREDAEEEERVLRVMQERVERRRRGLVRV